eukprot:CAMPEP_0180428954 /NCGR_PEP_ID=MMETSP1036_2-20121128/7104_1 /TAXON_ID=632150 /ORGANISM="Azadinium spinosum, Strain 3D9" /LENGTH=291 /DNA_ID=CAMNT_0022434609 /DNA_START=51 /DNA_END=923 /DNA_ORIENTATION=-
MTLSTLLKVDKDRLHADITTEDVLVSPNAARLLGDVALPHANWMELTRDLFEVITTAEQFRSIRAVVRLFGVDRLRDPETGLLTTGMTPFNIFARIASGITSQPSMAAQQAKLGMFKERFVIACNPPECDENWNNSSPEWIGKASMSKRHALLLSKDLHWEWFNVLTFGLLTGLHLACEKLELMKEAAMSWVAANADEGWPEADRVGLFLQVHAHCSMGAKAIHLHILDMDCLGPSFTKLAHQHIHIDTVLAVIQEERAHKEEWLRQQAEAEKKAEQEKCGDENEDPMAAF